MTGSTATRVSDPHRLAAVRATGLLDTEPETAFDDLARLASTMLGTRFALVTLVDERRSFWKSRIGIEGLHLAGNDPVPTENALADSFSQHVIDRGEPLLLGDVRADPRLRDKPLVTELGVASWAGVPLFSPDGEILGVFCVADTVTRMWRRRDSEVLRQLSEAATREIALREAHAQASQLAAERDLALARVQLLADIARSVSETLDITESVARLARLVVPVLGDWSIVTLRESNGVMRDVGWWHVDDQRRHLVDEFVADRWKGMVSEITETVTATHRPVIIRTDAVAVGLAALYEPRARWAWSELDPASFGIFPLVAGGRVVGTLSVARESTSAPFTDDDTEIGAAIADRAGIAVENARLYAQVHRTAVHHREASRVLQDAMLSRVPQPDHVRVVTRYRSAESNSQVGGDWYDGVVSADGALTVVIGDVAGHDIAAATVMGQLRNLLRAFIWNDPAEGPAQLISRLDRATRDLGLRTMTTLIVARVEQTAADRARGLRTVRWSSAGHPPPVFVGADGSAVALAGAPDPPLAVDPSRPRHDHTRTVEPGSTLLLYTDGLLETRALDHSDRLQLLIDTVGPIAGAEPDTLVDTALGVMLRQQQADDVAVLAVRFDPEP